MPNQYIQRFEAVAGEFGSGHSTYEQEELLSGNSLNNVFRRMNLGFRSGVCLGLAMGYLLYCKRYRALHPIVVEGTFYNDSRSAYLADDGNFHGVSDLQLFIGSVMQGQRNRGGGTAQFGNVVPVLEEGMFGVSLKHMQTRYGDFGADDICGAIFPSLQGGGASYYLLAIHTIRNTGHAVAAVSMVHPTTGERLIKFYEPNFGFVGFQGITAGAKFKEFMKRFTVDPLLGGNYDGTRCEVYRFQ